MREWLKELFRQNNEKVSSPNVFIAGITVILAILAIPASLLGLWAFYHHVWTLKKGLDGPAVQLIGLIIGGGGVGIGAAGYGMSKLGGGTPAPWRPPSTKPVLSQGE